MSLKTKYLGLELKNPLIVGSCNLVNNTDNLRKMEDAGAAAIVYKSLFEEQINLESLQLENELAEYTERHAEMLSLFPNLEHAGTEEYLENLSKARKAVSIPLIASINATYPSVWTDYAKQVEATGVDAIELNFFAVPGRFDAPGVEIEKEQSNILKEVKHAVKIPVSVKLSPFYTNVLNFIDMLDKSGVDGVVLFNRMFQPEIDTKTMAHYTPINLSVEIDNRLPLRYAGLLYGEINAAVCASTGIYSGQDVAKMILAGADCTQMVSVLYKKGIGHIAVVLKELENFMENHHFGAIADFRGKLSKKNTKDVYVYKRAQYVDMLLNSENIIKKYPLL